mgnify:CR=1 FL=1
MSAREHRTAVDWAEEIKYLVDEMYPDTEKIILLFLAKRSFGILHLIGGHFYIISLNQFSLHQTGVMRYYALMG